ncbi:MAG: phosphatase PAP2 family protein [Actinobacteria bacterium]|nr:phosphatase PAP2 family protein [Actinomycetota bacterium]
MTAIAQLLTSIDKAVFQALNSLAANNGVLDWFFRFGADDHVIPVVLAILVLLTIPLAMNRREREDSFAGLISVFFAVIISMALLLILNNMFFRPRPFTSYEVNLLFYHNTDSAFPSNPATLFFTMAASVFFYNKRVGAIMLLLGLYASFSRVVAGVHYPLDIAGGLFLGVASACIARAAVPLYTPFARKLTDIEYRVLGSIRTPAGYGARRGSGK